MGVCQGASGERKTQGSAPSTTPWQNHGWQNYKASPIFLPILSFCQIRSAFGAAEQDDSANFPANEVASGVGIGFGGWPIRPILVRPGTPLVRLWYTLKPQIRSMVPGFGTPGTPCGRGVGGVAQENVAWLGPFVCEQAKSR